MHIRLASTIINYAECYGYAWNPLDSAVMTMWAESRISHGLLVVNCWLTDQSTDVALVSYCSFITCSRTLVKPRIAVLGFVTHS
jgi:hypothetical protein